MHRLKPKRTIKKSELPQVKHGKFLDLQEQTAIQFFEVLHKRLLKEVQSILTSSVMEKSLTNEFEALAKSDRLMRRWTGKVPRLSLIVSEKVEKATKRYLLAIRYLLLGSYAGREARQAAEAELGAKVPPGIVFGTYLHAIDTERKFYEMLYEGEAPKIPMTLIQKSYEIIQRQTERQVNVALEDYKNRILDTVDVALAQHRFDNLFAIADKAHDVKEDQGKLGSVEHAVDKALVPLDKTRLKGELDGLTTKAKESFERTVKTTLGSITAVGAHQAMVEMFGAESNFMRAALVNVRDGKCCDHCEKFSRNSDGSLRLYALGDFAPSGANNYKKRAQWVLCIPPLHPNCRCFLVNLPSGFEIDEHGQISSHKGAKS